MLNLFARNCSAYLVESRHSSMDAEIQSQGERSEGSVQAYAIFGFWIAANPRYAPLPTVKHQDLRGF
jgi:hypothetical protein